MMEIAIATIGTVVVVVGIIIAMTTEVITPVNYKKKIENEVEVCIVDNDNELHCINKNLYLSQQKP